MIELQGHQDVAVADAMLARVIAAADSPAPVLLHGLDESCWPLLEHAGVCGVQTRIGMEDTLTLPDGSRHPRQRRAGGGGGASCSVGRGGRARSRRSRNRARRRS